MTTIDSKAEAMSRLADFLIGAEHHYDGQALTILVEGREAIRAYLAALPSPKVEEEPVAWRVKDFGDGWIPARSHGEALQLAASTGALIQPLYVSPSPVLADEGVMWTEVHPRGFYAYTRFGRYDVNGPFDEGTDGPWSWQLLQFSHDVTDRQTAPTEQDAKLAALADYRDRLGRIVREAWVKWARTQPKPKPSWLVPYDDLSEPDKEADRQIGEAVVALPTPPALTP